MLPSSTELRYFLEVSKTQNISRAAERIGISQPTLTQSIRKLEWNIGTRLLIRTKTGVHLTHAGKRICSQASQLLELWNSIQNQAIEDENELQGSFRLGCHPSVGRYTLPVFFERLAGLAPKIRVELVHDLSRRITDAVIGFKVDLGIVVNPVAHPDLVLRKMGVDQVGVFQSPNRYSDVIFGDPELIQTQAVLKLLKKTAFQYSYFSPCSNLEVIQALAASGAGYGILPARVAGSASLQWVDPELPVFSDEIFLVYRKEVMGSLAGKTLVAVCEKLLKG